MLSTKISILEEQVLSTCLEWHLRTSCALLMQQCKRQYMMLVVVFKLRKHVFCYFRIQNMKFIFYIFYCPRMFVADETEVVTLAFHIFKYFKNSNFLHFNTFCILNIQNSKHLLFKIFYDSQLLKTFIIPKFENLMLPFQIYLLMQAFSNSSKWLI